MFNTPDLYLGAFLILCGFILSLLNLQRIVKEQNTSFPYVLLSENLLLSCIGIAFIIRAVYDLKPLNVEMDNMEQRSADMMTDGNIKCNFIPILMSYGPLIVSLVNSFLSLVIDNYMHYKMIAEVKTNEEESTVQEISENYRITSRKGLKGLLSFWKKNFTYITVVLQWLLPVIITLSMYPMEVKEKIVLMNDDRGFHDTCMALVDITKQNCTSIISSNETEDLQKSVLGLDYLDMYDIQANKTGAKKIETVVNNVYKIIANLKNTTHYADFNVTTAPLLRIAKNVNEKCMKICFLDNKNLLLYMFVIAVVSYFIPITISTIILTQIHVMDIKKKNVKTYVSRELLYNVLFWTPVMFDTFLSLTLCSYSMNGMRTSIFNIIANVYQAVKNFMNTKYFKDNVVAPI